MLADKVDIAWWEVVVHVSRQSRHSMVGGSSPCLPTKSTALVACSFPGEDIWQYIFKSISRIVYSV